MGKEGEGEWERTIDKSGIKVDLAFDIATEAERIEF